MYCFANKGSLCFSIIHLPCYYFLSFQDSTCKDKMATCGVRISKYYNVMSTNVTDLKVKIFERGPISIAIDASHRSFSFYANGVYKEPKCGMYMYIVKYPACLLL